MLLKHYLHYVTWHNFLYARIVICIVCTAIFPYLECNILLSVHLVVFLFITSALREAGWS